MRYNHFTMLPEQAFQSLGGKMTLEGGSSQPAPAQPTTATQYNTNVPEYAKPYVTNMLGATQQQLFDMDSSGGISGFKPYQPYSSNVNDYFAGFSPMQTQAQQATANMQVPGQYNVATGIAGAAGMGSLGAGQQYNQMATNPNSVSAFMSPYAQAAIDPTLQENQRQFDIASTGRQAAAARSGAFGGSRQAIEQSEAQRNLGYLQSDTQAKGMQNAFQNAQQAQQFGANLGLQGYNQALQGASTLANIGGQDLAAQQSIANAQNTMGGQQQALEQNKINQGIQNYATAQQYPMMQLGLMSNMLRGLPMQSTSTQTYQAAPSTASQLIGSAGALTSAYKGLTSKEGGVIKGLAHGGSVGSQGYAVGGEIKQQLSMMPDDQLQQVMRTSASNEIRAMAAQILAEHKMAEQMTSNPEAGQGLMAANTGDTFTSMADGGIIAFGVGGETDDRIANYAWNPVTRQNEPVQGEPVAPMSAETTAGLAGTAPAKSTGSITSTNLGDIVRGLELERQAAGVTGSPRAAERAAIDKQIAGLNSKEASQNWFKAAEFFANMANTPGGLLRSATESGAKILPEFAKLKSEQAKIREDYAKSQAGIDEADRLERLGLVSKAEDIRENALKLKSQADISAADNAARIDAANIADAGHRYAADKQLEGQIKAAGIRTGQERQFDKLYRINLEALVQAGGGSVSISDPSVKLKAANAASASLGLAGEKLDAALLGRVAAEKTTRTKTDPTLKKYAIELLSAKEANIDPNSKKQTISQIEEKIKDREKEIYDAVVLELTTPVVRPGAAAAAPKKDPGLGGDTVSKTDKVNTNNPLLN